MAPLHLSEQERASMYAVSQQIVQTRAARQQVMRDQDRERAMVRGVVFKQQLQAAVQQQLALATAEQKQQAAEEYNRLSDVLERRVECIGAAYVDAAAYMQQLQDAQAERERKRAEDEARQAQRYQAALTQIKGQHDTVKMQAAVHQQRRAQILAAERGKAQSFAQEAQARAQAQKRKKEIHMLQELERRKRSPNGLAVDFRHTRLHERLGAPAPMAVPAVPAPSMPPVPDPALSAEELQHRAALEKRRREMAAAEAELKAQERFLAAQAKVRAEAQRQQMEAELAAMAQHRLKMKKQALEQHRLRLRDQRKQEDLQRVFEENFLQGAAADDDLAPRALPVFLPHPAAAKAAAAAMGGIHGPPAAPSMPQPMQGPTAAAGGGQAAAAAAGLPVPRWSKGRTAPLGRGQPRPAALGPLPGPAPAAAPARGEVAVQTEPEHVSQPTNTAPSPSETTAEAATTAAAPAGADTLAPRQPGSPGPRQAWPEAPTAREAAVQRAADAGPAGVALPGQGLDLGLGLEGEEDDALDAWGEEEVDRELARMKMELGIEDSDLRSSATSIASGRSSMPAVLVDMAGRRAARQAEQEAAAATSAPPAGSGPAAAAKSATGNAAAPAALGAPRQPASEVAAEAVAALGRALGSMAPGIEGQVPASPVAPNQAALGSTAAPAAAASPADTLSSSVIRLLNTPPTDSSTAATPLRPTGGKAGASARRRAAALARLHALTPGSLSLPSDMDLDEMLLYADLDLDELEGLAATGEGGEAGGTPGGRVGAAAAGVAGGRGSAGGAAAVAAALGLQGLGVLDVDVDVDLDAMSSASEESSANLSKLVAQGILPPDVAALLAGGPALDAFSSTGTTLSLPQPAWAPAAPFSVTLSPSTTDAPPSRPAAAAGAGGAQLRPVAPHASAPAAAPATSATTSLASLSSLSSAASLSATTSLSSLSAHIANLAAGRIPPTTATSSSTLSSAQPAARPSGATSASHGGSLFAIPEDRPAPAGAAGVATSTSSSDGASLHSMPDHPPLAAPFSPTISTTTGPVTVAGAQLPGSQAPPTTLSLSSSSLSLSTLAPSQAPQQPPPIRGTSALPTPSPALAAALLRGSTAASSLMPLAAVPGTAALGASGSGRSTSFSLSLADLNRDLLSGAKGRPAGPGAMSLGGTSLTGSSPLSVPLSSLTLSPSSVGSAGKGKPQRPGPLVFASLGPGEEAKQQAAGRQQQQPQQPQQQQPAGGAAVQRVWEPREAWAASASSSTLSLPTAALGAGPGAHAAQRPAALLASPSASISSTELASLLGPATAVGQRASTSLGALGTPSSLSSIPSELLHARTANSMAVGPAATAFGSGPSEQWAPQPAVQAPTSPLATPSSSVTGTPSRAGSIGAAPYGGGSPYDMYDKESQRLADLMAGIRASLQQSAAAVAAAGRPASAASAAARTSAHIAPESGTFVATKRPVGAIAAGGDATAQAIAGSSLAELSSLLATTAAAVRRPLERLGGSDDGRSTSSAPAGASSTGRPRSVETAPVGGAGAAQQSVKREAAAVRAPITAAASPERRVHPLASPSSPAPSLPSPPSPPTPFSGASPASSINTAAVSSLGASPSPTRPAHSPAPPPPPMPRSTMRSDTSAASIRGPGSEAAASVRSGSALSEPSAVRAVAEAVALQLQRTRASQLASAQQRGAHHPPDDSVSSTVSSSPAPSLSLSISSSVLDSVARNLSAVVDSSGGADATAGPSERGAAGPGGVQVGASGRVSPAPRRGLALADLLEQEEQHEEVQQLTEQQMLLPLTVARSGAGTTGLPQVRQQQERGVPPGLSTEPARPAPAAAFAAVTGRHGEASAGTGGATAGAVNAANAAGIPSVWASLTGQSLEEALAGLAAAEAGSQGAGLGGAGLYDDLLRSSLALTLSSLSVSSSLDLHQLQQQGQQAAWQRAGPMDGETAEALRASAGPGERAGAGARDAGVGLAGVQRQSAGSLLPGTASAKESSTSLGLGEEAEEQLRLLSEAAAAAVRSGSASRATAPAPPTAAAAGRDGGASPGHGIGGGGEEEDREEDGDADSLDGLMAGLMQDVQRGLAAMDLLGDQSPPDRALHHPPGAAALSLRSASDSGVPLPPAPSHAPTAAAAATGGGGSHTARTRVSDAGSAASAGSGGGSPPRRAAGAGLASLPTFSRGFADALVPASPRSPRDSEGSDWGFNPVPLGTQRQPLPAGEQGPGAAGSVGVGGARQQPYASAAYDAKGERLDEGDEDEELFGGPAWRSEQQAQAGARPQQGQQQQQHLPPAGPQRPPWLPPAFVASLSPDSSLLSGAALPRRPRASRSPAGSPPSSTPPAPHTGESSPPTGSYSFLQAPRASQSRGKAPSSVNSAASHSPPSSGGSEGPSSGGPSPVSSLDSLDSLPGYPVFEGGPRSPLASPALGQVGPAHGSDRDSEGLHLPPGWDPLPIQYEPSHLHQQAHEQQQQQQEHMDQQQQLGEAAEELEPWHGAWDAVRGWPARREGLQGLAAGAGAQAFGKEGAEGGVGAEAEGAGMARQQQTLSSRRLGGSAGEGGGLQLQVQVPEADVQGVPGGPVAAAGAGPLLQGQEHELVTSPTTMIPLAGLSLGSAEDNVRLGVPAGEEVEEDGGAGDWQGTAEGAPGEDGVPGDGGAGVWLSPVKLREGARSPPLGGDVGFGGGFGLPPLLVGSGLESPRLGLSPVRRRSSGGGAGPGGGSVALSEAQLASLLQWTVTDFFASPARDEWAVE